MTTPLIPAFSFFDSLLAMTAHTMTNNKPMASERRHIFSASVSLKSLFLKTLLVSRRYSR